MTGGQCSVTTPNEAVVGSGFLNRVEKPLDLYSVAKAAGAPWVACCSAYQKDLAEIMEQAIRFKGFSIVEIQGVCPGRYTKRNKLTPKAIEESLAERNLPYGEVAANQRPEYSQVYKKEASAQAPAPRPQGIEAQFKPPEEGRRAAVILGSAGQRVITAGELLGLAGHSAGLQVTQKNEYNVTVLRGPSISELILSPEKIEYTGLAKPDVVLALAPEGVERRQAMLAGLDSDTLVIQAAGVEIPQTQAKVHTVDFKGQGIKNVDWSLAALAVMAKLEKVISLEMLNAALANRFKGKVLESAGATVEKVVP
jgi:Pyruvate/2-oxoacid:ferredoxin oxidoreductase gamma subunit